MQELSDDYHVRRARQELDLGYRAEGHNAAASHLALAALHMARAKKDATADEELGIGGVN